MPSLIEQRDALIASAKSRAEGAKSAGRALTGDEVVTINKNIEEIKELSAQISRANESQSLLDALGALGPGEGGPLSTGSVLGLSGASRTALGARIAAKMLDTAGTLGSKALMPSGSVVTDVPLVPDPVPLGRIPSSLLDALTVVQHSTPVFSFLQQQTRTNAAAPVAAGDPKPVSIYEMVEVNTKLEIVAHLSEKVNKYWLEDNRALATFVSNELVFGLSRAVEGQVVNGSGVSPQLHGILTTSGILAQPAVGTDLLATTRSAITALENQGHTPGLFVFTPADWQRIELSRTSGSGELELTTPVDRAAQRLWGVQVVTTPTVAAGTGLLIDRSAVAVDTDTAGVRVEWNPWSDFSTNEVTARCEGRFAVSVYQPAGCCRITLPAAIP